MDITENFEETNYGEDQEGEGEDEDLGGIPADTRLFRKLKAQKARTVSLAFTVPDDVPPQYLTGSGLVWTRDAMAAFAAIRKAAREVDGEYMRNFPYAYLRGAIEVSLPNAIRIEPDMGLSAYDLDSFGKPGQKPKDLEPFVFLESAPKQNVPKILVPILNNWIVNNLIPRYAEPGRVEKRLMDHMSNLAATGGLMEIRPFNSRAMPWPWEKKTGTTQRADALAYQALADVAAKALAGEELFQGLGPMLRLISASGRGNSAELVTAPKPIGDKGTLSLVVTLRVETVPALHQPLLIMDVSKRRWLNALDDETYDHSQISGTAFSRTHRDRAFGFSMIWRYKDRLWTIDNAFDAIRRALGIPLHVHSASDILRGEAKTSNVRVELAYRPGITEDGYGIQAGVPERDKLEAFKAATAIFGKIGLRPFESMTRVRVSHGKAHEGAARMIDPPTLLGALLEKAASGSPDETQFTPGYLQTLSEVNLKDMMLRQFRLKWDEVFGAAQLLRGNRKGTPAGHYAALESLIEANREALRRLYGEVPPEVILFHEEGNQAALDVRLLKAAIELLWGDLPIITNRLPRGAHGPEALLDSKLPNGKRASAIERSRRRVEAWRGVTEHLRRSGKRYLCLVMARRFYADPAGIQRPKHDDRVNKPSTRRALASAGAAVQFLIPPQRTQKDEKIKLADFLLRLQAAMKDLLWAHWGRIDTVPTAVETCFPDPATRPREIIGITIVRRQAGRANAIGSSFLPVAFRIDVATGRCDVRCAYESQAGKYESSPWEHLPAALSRIARLSPIKLAEDPRERTSRFMRFVDEVISTAVDEGAHPVVLVDSSNAVRLWPWLADSRMSATDITLGQQQEWMQDAWAGARIIRIRQGLAPSLIDDKIVALAETQAKDARPTNGLKSDVEIPVPTSPGGGLFRIGSGEQSRCVAYLSVGRKTLHQEKRGVSCHQSTMLPGVRKEKVDGKYVPIEPVRNAEGSKVLGLIEHEPFVDQWPSPNPIEIVVTLRQAGDSPDLLAEFVERLRYGFGHYREWSSLPAPLFFERVVRDYISHFQLEEAVRVETEEDAADASPQRSGSNTSTTLPLEWGASSSAE